MSLRLKICYFYNNLCHKHVAFQFSHLMMLCKVNIYSNKEMIKIYTEAMALQNSSNPEIGDTIKFSLKSMLEYYSSL